MNINEANYTFRTQLASDLVLLKAALDRCNVSKKSIGAIDRAITHLKDKSYLPPTNLNPATGNAFSTPNSWGYDISGFDLEIDLSGSMQYPKIIKNALVQVSINVKGEYSSPSDTILDPFRHLEFNIVVEGKSRKAKDHILSYHLDRHMEGQNPSREVHPIYHFQMGGRKLKGSKYNHKHFGSHLIIDSPRFMHYPMDFVLGVDFVISNFAPDLWQSLKRDRNYLKALKNSQERTLRPYIGSISHYFKFHTTKNDWDTKTIFPQIIK